MSNYALPLSALAIPDGAITQADLATKVPWTHGFSGVGASLGLSTTDTFVLGHASVGIGFIPGRALNVTRLAIQATSSGIAGGPMNIIAQLRKNTNVGTAADIIVATLSALNSNTGISWESTTIQDVASMNGTTDYYTLALRTSTGTVSLLGAQFLIEGLLV